MNGWLTHNIPALIVVLGVLITVHEWGHYAVARHFGVRVLRFSIGFGRALWRRTGRDGTEYVVALIPLGGYVKMLDEREGPVDPALLGRAYNRKPVAVRAAIVAAGPLVNLLFAVLVYWALFVAGTTAVAPVVGAVEDGSPAAEAGLVRGDEVLAVAGEPLNTWDELSMRLVAHAGATGDILLRVRGADGIEQDIAVPVQGFLAGDDRRSPAMQLGLRPLAPPLPAVFGEVLDDGAAAAAGIAGGDRVLSVDGMPVSGWTQLVEIIRASPGRPLRLVLERDGVQREVQLTPAAVEEEEGRRPVGRIGAGPRPPELSEWPAEALRHVDMGPLEGLAAAVAKTWDLSVLSLDAVRKMLVGELSVKSLGGPVSIAEGAGATAAGGLEPFLVFLAFVSISLGVFNLLPLPVLDGGHLVFLGIEAVAGRPLPERVLIALTNVSALLLMALMLFVIYNDFARL